MSPNEEATATESPKIQIHSIPELHVSGRERGSHIHERFVFDVLFTLSSETEQRGPHYRRRIAHGSGWGTGLNAFVGNANKNKLKYHKMCILAHSICTLAVFLIHCGHMGSGCAALPFVMRWVAQLLDAVCWSYWLSPYCCCQNFSSGVSSEWRTAAHARFIKMQCFLTSGDRKMDLHWFQLCKKSVVQKTHCSDWGLANNCL